MYPSFYNLYSLDWLVYGLFPLSLFICHFYFLQRGSLIISACCAFVYYRYRYDRIRQVIHRQKLAKMILENGWYETKQTQSSSFFEDIPNGKAKDKISYIPKMYYRLEKGLLHIQTEI